MPTWLAMAPYPNYGNSCNLTCDTYTADLRLVRRLTIFLCWLSDDRFQMVGGEFEGNSEAKKFIDAAGDLDAAEANKAVRRLLPEERRVRVHF